MGNDDRIGALWWRASVLAAGRRLGQRIAGGLGLFGGVSLALHGCYDQYVAPDDLPTVRQDRDEIEQRVDALDLQRRAGWNVGQPERSLVVSESVLADADGTTAWRDDMASLAVRMQPQQAAWIPYYAPTLFQSLIGPEAIELRDELRPLHSGAMDQAFFRGRALAAQFADVGWPADTAVVVDLPGPESVAVATALAERFDPIFTFGNWPHPLGVVPSHRTLAAVLYYAPWLERARAARLQPAAPVFVLDAARLAPYRDEDTQFDNRYVVNLPTAEALRARGIKHVLYVTADGAQTEELDDLNCAFVAYGEAGLDVQLLALADFEESSEPPPLDTPATFQVSWDGGFLYYGGDPYSNACFWSDFGWYAPPPGVLVGPPTGRRPMHAMYRPHLRPTLFVQQPLANLRGAPGAGAHVILHAARPSGFGEVAVRTSRADGEVTGVRAGRSGTYGSNGAHLAGSGQSGGQSSGWTGGWSSGRASGGHSVSLGRSGSFGRAGGGGSSG